jgi:hypothetical protein
MPRLTFTNLLGSDIVVGNADGNSKSFNIPVAGAVVDLTGLQLESVGPQLDTMKLDGWVTWVKTQNPGVSDDLEILSGSPSRTAMFSSGAVAAKSATSVHANLIGSVGRAKLLLTIGTSDIDTVVMATTGGAAGNNITVAMVGDSAPAANVTISRVGTAITIHYETAVSTVADVEAAITALAGDDDIIGVMTAGTGATVLAVADDNIAATNLAGGSDTGNTFPGAFTNPVVARNVRVTMAAGYDAGDVTVNGTDMTDAAISEVFTAGSGVVRVGVKAFKTVTSATKALYGTHPTAVVSLGTGDTIGVPFDVVDTVGFAYVGTTIEAVTLDPVYNTFVPTTTPAATTYVVVCNVSP